ncbi:MAG: hypothetical protein DMG90_19640 [Acidobacteria bacterium]|nr:MAG: hypothetical protein DMG91_14400 [Acidobacteriota bacterium]PYV86939.1 MAG: hypothetical protein DMG90_19640 [Acidobacteriota bacterium]
MSHIPYPVATLGSICAIVAAVVLHYTVRAYLNRRVKDPREHYRRSKSFSTFLGIATAIALILLWSHPLRSRGTFLGLIGAGVAIALRDPLLSIAGRIAIFAGKMYSAGDRIQLETLSGDVIDVGFFYTRMMEIGNWIGGDQASGRIVQMPNSKVFGTAIFNYTQNFSYIWDEVHLPITYDSNFDSATRILLDVGGEYTKEFLKGAQEELEEMRRYFLISEVELKPSVFLKITSNWVQLSMRYVVDPKKRRSANSFIYTEVFKRLRTAKDIKIASETMDLTLRAPKAA